ncbi:hypothetical protein CRYUN_Cryun20dG0094600 [Craigia yunnanensis]
MIRPISVIYRDLKSSNILLDKEFNAKLSDFGLAKLGPIGDKTHVSSRVMGTYGYCAPEYQRTGQLTVKSDVYSFGVVLLEFITGRRAIDTTRRNKEQNLVTWCSRNLVRPLISDVVTALSFLGNGPDASTDASSFPSPESEKKPGFANGESYDEVSKQEHQRAVAEAIELGSTSRHTISQTHSALL